MKRFFVCNNGGVTATMSEDTRVDILKDLAIRTRLACKHHYTDISVELDRGLGHLCVPIFTFVSTKRFTESPWFTGDSDLFNALVVYLESGGAEFAPWGFYVPFSNGMELGMHGEREMENELSYVTTERQFQDTFGISRNELLQKMGRPTT